MPTNTISSLYGPEYLTASAAVLVSGTSAGTMVKNILIVNSSGTTETVELYIHTAAPDNSKLVYKAALSPGDFSQFEGTMLIPSGSSLYGKSTNASAATVSVHGMSMT